jgi:hypothetical protein
MITAIMSYVVPYWYAIKWVAAGCVLLRVRFFIWHALFAVWSAVWTAAWHVSAYAVQLVTLSLPADACILGACVGVFVVRGLLPGSLLWLLDGGLRFLGSPVTAALQVLAACLEDGAPVLNEIHLRVVGQVLHFLYVFFLDHLVPPAVVQGAMLELCARVEAAKSLTAREYVTGWCEVTREALYAKLVRRQEALHSWWVDLLLLVWLGLVLLLMWRRIRDSSSRGDGERRQGQEAARQRKEGKAVQRKMMRQLMWRGLC